MGNNVKVAVLCWDVGHVIVYERLLNITYSGDNILALTLGDDWGKPYTTSDAFIIV